MPITVPRASVTQAADDLKARDALLRGFPEVESVIGKAGRADTPTDPAPLDMVETFVNFRPKELWPKRVLQVRRRRAADATRAGRAGGARASCTRRRTTTTATTWSTTPARRRWSASTRRCASWRCCATSEFERELGPLLTRFAVDETIAPHARGRRPALAGRHGRRSGDRRTGRQAHARSTAAGWPKHPALEDVTQLSQDVAKQLARRRARSRRCRAAAWNCKQSPLPQLVERHRRSSSARERKTFAGEVLRRGRSTSGRACGASGSSRSTGSCSTAAPKRSPGTPWKKWPRRREDVGLLARRRARRRDAERFAAAAVNAQLGQAGRRRRPSSRLSRCARSWKSRFATSVFLLAAADRAQGRPGGRRNGRACCRCPAGATSSRSRSSTASKCSRPACAPTSASRCSAPIWTRSTGSARRSRRRSSRSTGPAMSIAAPIMGKGYLEIDIDREKAARYGITVEDIQNEIEVALGGRAVTYTVEKRDRFPVRIRYARADREDEESIRRLLVSPGSMATRRHAAHDRHRRRAPAMRRWRHGQRPTTSAEQRTRPARRTRAKGKPLIPLERRGRRAHRRRAGDDQERKRPAAQLRHAQCPRPRHGRLRRRGPARRRPEGAAARRRPHRMERRVRASGAGGPDAAVRLPGGDRADLRHPVPDVQRPGRRRR